MANKIEVKVLFEVLCSLILKLYMAEKKQPEMAGTIRTTMLIGQAVSETTGLYGLIIAILIVLS